MNNLKPLTRITTSNLSDILKAWPKEADKPGRSLYEYLMRRYTNVKPSENEINALRSLLNNEFKQKVFRNGIKW
jgi:tRNA C32,U32 (ribose-2'-O)-methylase TrmJ